MEGFDKVTFVIKSAGNRRFLDGNIFGGEHFAGAFDSIVIQIIYRSALCHASEIAAEIFGVHTCNFGQHIQTDIIVVVLGYIGKDIFDGI